MDPEPETLHLVRRAQAGDEEAMRALLERHAPEVYELVRRRMGRHLRMREDSMDVAHSVMGDALRDMGGYRGRGDGEFMRWLARIVENKLRKRARGMGYGDRNPARRIEIEPARTEVAGFEPTAPGPTPSIELRAREDRSRLRETLARLPEREQRLIRLRKLEGLPWPEVVRRSDEPSVKAAQSAYARAMSRLAKALGGEDGESGEAR